jgi:hypothetical protein
MQNHKRVLVLICATILLLQLGCSVPRGLWHGDDIQPSEMDGKPGHTRVLLASHASEFKNAIVGKLKTVLQQDSASLKVIGVEQLNGINTEGFDAVVVVGNCIAWGLDKKVQGFLDGQRDKSKIILVVTSGNGKWLPDKMKLDVDAVATASGRSKIDEVAYKILNLIHGKVDSEKSAP